MKLKHIITFSISVCMLFLCCTRTGEQITTDTKELFFTGFGPAQNFVPEEVTIEYETTEDTIIR